MATSTTKPSHICADFLICNMNFLSCFQAGEFFHSAQSNATAQQRENESHQSADGSLDSPLLLEQVLQLSCSFYWLFYLNFR